MGLTPGRSLGSGCIMRIGVSGSRVVAFGLPCIYATSFRPVDDILEHIHGIGECDEGDS
jgi:hypothetical protein